MPRSSVSTAGSGCRRNSEHCEGQREPSTKDSGKRARAQGAIRRVRHVEADGVRLFPVGLGTWQFGSGEWGYGTAYATNVAPRIVERSLDLGVNLIDTAEIYAFGRSERIVGAALSGRRDEAFLATKLLPVLPLDPIVSWRARASLRRLGTGYVDLYQLHWPNPLVPPSRVADALAKLLDSGIVSHVGVSNYPLSRWQELERLVGRPVATMHRVQCPRTLLRPENIRSRLFGGRDKNKPQSNQKNRNTPHRIVLPRLMYS